MVALERTEYNDIVANYGSFQNAAKRALALASGAMKHHLTKVLAVSLSSTAFAAAIGPRRPIAATNLSLRV